MVIKEVTDKKESKEFLKFHKWHYRDDPNWVCPLDSEFNAVFNPDKNRTFTHGILKRWILLDGDSQVIGRIAAFIDYYRSKAYRQPTGGVGFFEVVEDEKAAFMLFDTAVEWLKDNGMEAVDGPVTFGSNESNWGLLVEGFVQQAYGMPYNKRYYKDYFEKYGFRNYFNQYSFHRDIASVNVFPERFMKISEWISRKPGYSFEHFKFSNADKYINDLVDIYNTTWSEFREDYQPMEPTDFDDIVKNGKAFLDEELIWFAYHEGEPIAFFILFPDLNQILKHLNGKLHLWNIIKFFYLKKKKTMTRIRAIVAGVKPAFRNSGVESAIFKCLYHVFRRKLYYKELELSWVGDFNEPMLSMYNAIGAEKAKMHVTYRYMINKNIEFNRLQDEMKELVERNDQKSNNK
ncbi:MAG: GNAT family N-acetyltransferase [Bacteroidota bacterium]|nr:GNAT family N-acetyltransferase [Bacteroidota bacterium]